MDDEAFILFKSLSLSIESSMQHDIYDDDYDDDDDDDDDAYIPFKSFVISIANPMQCALGEEACIRL
jgi:hypothetical protein